MAELSDGFTNEEWDEFAELDPEEAGRRVVARRRDVCVWTEMLVDECPHCTGDLSPLLEN